MAEELLARRNELKWSQDDVAVKTDIDRAYISRLEAGKKNPSLSVIYKLAQALDLTFVELAGRVDDRYRRMQRKANKAEKPRSE